MDPAEPRWLDEQEHEVWMSLVCLLVRLPAALELQLQRDAGLNHFEYQVLTALSEAPERTLRLSEVAALAEGSLPRLSQVVSRLERRGWVRRTPDPTDGRFTLAVLTEEGWDQVVAIAPGHVEAVRRHVFDPLTKSQQRQLRAIAQRISATTAAANTCSQDRQGLPAAQLAGISKRRAPSDDPVL
ncbi:MAG TPA: MarR family winged helix-turn-helix transcriptional regulator [Propionibacteriaceae bacterium]|nr:MarR family winged helix-turn-helix transcriptional regulator [Propionibacteriaceae bacterium]